MKTFFCLLIFFQSKYITVVDSETNKPIPFVSFTGIHDHKGGYANENGVVFLTGNITQSFIISCVGYASDTFNIKKDTIQLKPLVIDLPTVQVVAKKTKFKSKELGFFKKNSWISWAIQEKSEFYIFISNPDTAIKWQIKSIKIAVSGYRKKKFESFKIRPILKDVSERKPNKDLLINNIIVDVYKGQKFAIIELAEPIILPKGGCFVGFEAIGYSNKVNEFVPYSDFIKIPSDENVAISIPLVKSNTTTIFRTRNGKYWFGSDNDSHNAFAFGMEVLY